MTSSFHHAVRSLTRSPGFALGVLATFALGIGVNTAVFSAAWTLLLSPLPIAEPERVVTIWQTAADNDHGAAPANFLDWRREARSFTGMVAYSQRSRILSSADRPARIDVAEVSSQFFDLLGVDAAEGRTFHGGERATLAVVSDSLWRGQLGGRAIDGAKIVLDGQAFEITGVAPPGFDLPDASAAWILAPNDVAGLGLDVELDTTTLRDARYLGVYARLQPGISTASADAEMREIGRRLELAFPEENAGNGARIVPLAESLGSGARAPLGLLAAGAACVLLVACVNVAGLLLARALARQRELAVRKALGASRWRQLAEPLTESALLALGGGGLGVALAAWGAPRLVAAIPDAAIAGRATGSPPEVVAFAASVAVLAAFAATLAPAAFALRTSELAALGSARGVAGPPRERLRGALVVAQAALAIVLVAGALLMTRTLARTLAIDPGFEPARTTSLRLWLPGGQQLSPAERRAALSAAVDAARRVRGVDSAGGTLKLPLTGASFSAGARIEGHEFAPGEEPDISWRVVTPDYFRTLGTALFAGREFEAADSGDSEPVSIVNRALAERYWPDEDPIGKRIATGIDSEDGWTRVVGVVADTPQVALTQPARAEMYRPVAQESRFGSETLALVVRTSEGFSPAALERALAAASPHLVVDAPRTLAEVVRDATGRERVVGALLGLFGALALLLAGIGLYGVLALAVAARRREFGLRLAVGASGRDLVLQVLRRTVSHAALGAAIGLAGALAVGRALASWLWQVSPSDPWSLAGAVAALCAAAALAAWLPARRAARLDPATVLREE